MKKALAVLLFALPAVAQDYRFDEVKRKVEVNATRIAKGQQAKGGDAVETGWFSYALISAEGHRAKFEIFSATEVKLADGTPGVILSLERGRIRAAFDKITGSEPRVVKTPGALLAVRGTQFDVYVDQAGDTVVDVWEGTVEIQSPLAPPAFVNAGEESTFGRHRPPTTQPMPEHRRQRDPNREGNRGEHGGRDGMRPPDRTNDPHGGTRRQPPPTQQPPTQHPRGGHHAPPQKPPTE